MTVGPAVGTIPRRHEGLLVLDVDEVVLHFIDPFAALLEERGARLHAESFRLTGNVRSISTGAAVSGHELSAATAFLYETQEERQRPVEGAVQALRRLAPIVDIVFLTAMTPGYYEHRRRLLDRLGLGYPMIATERSKGAVIAELAEGRTGPIVFIDDLPPNLAGVQRSVPSARLVHLMASDVFRQHLPPLPRGAAAAADWNEAEAIVRRLLGTED